MSDWDSVTKIGSRHNGPGATPRETTIKGKSAINAAQRSGAILSTEKKYATGNAIGKGGDGQHLTKVDRSDDIVKIDKVNPKASEALKKRRNEDGFKMTRKELAAKCNVKEQEITAIESGEAKTGQALDSLLAKIETHIKISLRGSTIGQPKERQFKRNQKK